MHDVLWKLLTTIMGSVGGICLAIVATITLGVFIGLAYLAAHPIHTGARGAAEIVLIVGPPGVILGGLFGALLGWRLADPRNHGTFR